MDEKIYTLTDEGKRDGEPVLTQEEREAVVMNDALGLVLEHLGVDIRGNIERQTEEKEIIVENIAEDESSKGYYVLQRREKEIIPVAFIGNTRHEDDHVRVDIVMFRGAELVS
ncbi:MAG: hypothetical protein LBV07_06120 [Syntrophobacterales bacterium]|nr:hypothetical protein [Syntrophobacterales bacterium]